MTGQRIEAQSIVIEKNKGITHSLKKLVESNPNSIISDGKITSAEWNATLDKLIELNQKRKEAGKTLIFQGGTDKTRAGWHNSFVVHPNQVIEFTSEEISELYTAMGVTFSSTSPQISEPVPDTPSVTEPLPSQEQPTLVDSVQHNEQDSTDHQQTNPVSTQSESGNSEITENGDKKQGFWQSKGGKILKWGLITAGVVAAGVLLFKNRGKMSNLFNKKAAPVSPTNPVGVQNPIEQSLNFQKNHKIGVGEKILDGYKDGGRHATILSDGSITPGVREIMVVDRSRDKVLQDMIDEVTKKAKRMKPKEKAAYLQDYIYNKCGEHNLSKTQRRLWENSVYGKEVLIGDIAANNPPVAVCRHRSLLYKILGDEIGLNVELQRGDFVKNGHRGGHVWNVVKFKDGTGAIYDAMHNKTSSITPGKVAKYAEYYFDIAGNRLY